MNRHSFLPVLAGVLLAGNSCLSQTPAAPRSAAGAVTAAVTGGSITLANKAVRATWTLKGESLTLDRVSFASGGAIEARIPAFVLNLGDGSTISSIALRPAVPPAVVDLPANAAASVRSEQLPGKAVEIRYSLPEKTLDLLWRAILRDGSAYVRQELVLVPRAEGVVVRKLAMLQMELPGARVAGSVRGSPVVTDNLFLAIEHPASESRAADSALQWTPSDFAQADVPVTLHFDLAGLVTEAGDYEIEFQYKGGSHRLDVTRAALLADGKPAAEDAHHGFAGLPSRDNRYTLKLAGFDAKTRYALDVTAYTNQGTDSNGIIRILRNGKPAVGKSPVRVECSYSRGVPLPAGKPFAISAVIGGAENGQLRRAFNQYVERERAHPYRQFPHYNSWFHLNIDRPKNRMTEAEAVKAVNDIGTELTARRGFTLKAYVMDDGWDSHEDVWNFNENFPRGFTNVADAAAKYKAGIGLWMSPFGGYGEPHNTRVRYGSQMGFETNANGLSMAGKNYQAHFLKTTLRMIRDYHACFFKFDGMGGGNFADGGDSAYANDMDAMFNVILRGIRQANPDTYISATVGTWPSPFWLRYADSIWRQGPDTGFAGVGNGREKWITCRDATAYERIVRRGPFYPISALMLHGIVISDRGNAGGMPRTEDSVRHEVRSFFGTGTSLQELYVSPQLLTPAMWDALAESGKWALRNQDCLMDSHWLGGDPGKLDVYGFASWIPGKGTLTLRNPSDKPQTFRLDAGAAFELPASAPKIWKLVSPYKDQSVQTITAEVGKPLEITLQPLEVLVFDALPAGR